MQFYQRWKWFRIKESLEAHLGGGFGWKNSTDITAGVYPAISRCEQLGKTNCTRIAFQQGGLFYLTKAAQPKHFPLRYVPFWPMHQFEPVPGSLYKDET